MIRFFINFHRMLFSMPGRTLIQIKLFRSMNLYIINYLTLSKSGDPMLPQSFKKAKPIIDQIEKHGYKAYFVGGCVRDYLLKHDRSEERRVGKANEYRNEQAKEKRIEYNKRT